MKFKEVPSLSFLLGADHFVYKQTETEQIIDIYVKSRSHSCKCPVCAEESDFLHSTYVRTLQDTPIHCKQTFLHCNVYKYYCINEKCDCKVFMEDLPFAKPSQVRTDALTSLILGVSMFLSNEGASKVLSLLGVDVSNDTIRRMYERIKIQDNPDVEGVGIDDVATRKGQKYATAIYDLKDHSLIALLDGRDADTLKEWLKGHQKIKVVARDRASAYASAIREILPDCIQVADRFHLLQNLLEKLKEIFYAELPHEIYIKDDKILDKTPEKILTEKKMDIKKLEQLDYDNTLPTDADGNIISFNNKIHNRNGSEYKNQEESRKKK